MNIVDLRNYPKLKSDQINFIDEFVERFGVRITNVVALYYVGVAGGEYSVYSANKLYIALNYQISSSGASSVNVPFIRFYDELNNTLADFSNASQAWDATAANMQYKPNHLLINNFWFSRATLSVYNYHIFNGFRLTLI